jgi:hypothetical protein
MSPLSKDETGRGWLFNFVSVLFIYAIHLLWKYEEI